MNSALIVGIAVVALFALVFVFTTLSRRDGTRAIGFLNRETRAARQGQPARAAGRRLVPHRARHRTGRGARAPRRRAGPGRGATPARSRRTHGPRRDRRDAAPVPEPRHRQLDGPERGRLRRRQHGWVPLAAAGQGLRRQDQGRQVQRHLAPPSHRRRSRSTSPRPART